MNKDNCTQKQKEYTVLNINYFFVVGVATILLMVVNKDNLE